VGSLVQKIHFASFGEEAQTDALTVIICNCALILSILCREHMK